MAYPTVSAPYGLKPINRLDGMPYAGAFRQVPIASDLATGLFYGDAVKLVVGGTIEASDTSGATSEAVIGVFVGCQYVNKGTNQTMRGQYYPGSAIAGDAVAFIVDDPYAVFKVACTDGTDITPVGQNIVGTNVPGVLGTGNVTTGDSTGSVDVTAADDSATLAYRVIAGVPETVDVNGDFTEVIVKVNVNQYNNATGNTLV